MSRQFIKEHPGEWVCRDGIRATGCLGDKLWGIRNRGRGLRIRALPPHRIGTSICQEAPACPAPNPCEASDLPSHLSAFRVALFSLASVHVVRAL